MDTNPTHTTTETNHVSVHAPRKRAKPGSKPLPEKRRTVTLTTNVTMSDRLRDLAAEHGVGTSELIRALTIGGQASTLPAPEYVPVSATPRSLTGKFEETDETAELVNLSLRLSDSEHDALKKLATARGQSMSEVVRQAIIHTAWW